MEEYLEKLKIVIKSRIQQVEKNLKAYSGEPNVNELDNFRLIGQKFAYEDVLRILNTTEYDRTKKEEKE